jgi:hypothetical protein
LKNRKPGTLSKEQQILSNTTLKAYEQDLIAHEMGDTLWGVFYKSKI